MSEVPEAVRHAVAVMAANARWAKATKAEREANGAAGQAGLMARFEREVDPDGQLTPKERARRAENAWRSHMARMQLASLQSRARRRAARLRAPAEPDGASCG